ncbi:myelin-oligodendrocyte glycoprotein-like isoform X2 [Anabas testudineus]|uniref:myelin-oligodendrocyte glycoprotein-like isoform X2 n=1 Tax=Anabas testudineus TaxID=64144 RepID=UPI000E460554|nr:myelin-oligodendrocyte glycoprotein-like isoform X2 [Anabas testudineus]
MKCFTLSFAVMMKTLLMSLMLNVVVAGPCGSTPIVDAEEGHNVTLQCCFGAQNLKGRTVDWKRADLNRVVHAFRHGTDFYDPQMDQYKHRTALNHEDLTRGIMTLQIFSVQLSDGGKYMCNVPNQRSKVIELKVRRRNEAMRDSNTTRSAVDEDANRKKEPESENDEGSIVGAVCGAVGAVVAVGVLVKVLIKCGKIQIWRRLSGRKKQDMTANCLQLESLTSPPRDDDDDDDDGMHGTAALRA